MGDTEHKVYLILLTSRQIACLHVLAWVCVSMACVQAWIINPHVLHFMFSYKCHGVEMICWLMMTLSGLLHILQCWNLSENHVVPFKPFSLIYQRIQGSGYGNFLETNEAFDLQLCVERSCQEVSVSTTSCTFTHTAWTEHHLEFEKNNQV